MTTPHRLLLAALVSAALAATALSLAPPATTPPASRPTPTGFRLVIDYAEGVEKHFTPGSIPHRPGMTVLDAMTAAKALPAPRGLPFEHRGSAATAFLTSIDGLKNEGGGGTSRNWQFFINGEKAKESFGLATIDPGDEVVWAFKPLEKTGPRAPEPRDPANNPARP